MIFENGYELFKFIEIYNSTIIDAVDHGGDPGGPYFCNEDGLKESIGMMIAKITECNEELTKTYPLAIVYDENGHIPMIAVLAK